jgi:hypothetical protein
VATPETEGEWLAFAEHKPARQIERTVAGLRPGQRPTDRPAADGPKRLSFDVLAPTWGLVQEVRQQLVQEKEGSVTDDELVSALVRSFLGKGEREEGLSAYQVAITVCDRCKVATQKAGPDDVVLGLGDARLEQALCDALRTRGSTASRCRR